MTRSSTSPMLVAEQLHKRYGDIPALTGVDLAIDRGEICGLIGPNGAGKTTLASIIAGLRQPDGGTVTINGIDALRDGRAARRSVGFVPQELGVYTTISVRDNLRFFGELTDLRGATLRRRIDEVAEALELTDLLPRSVRELSGGEKRRVHTAAAMLHRPELLLLDEPTAGVDVTTRARVLDAVRQLADDGTAIWYSTHYMPELESMDASIAIIDHGHLIARGSLADLVAQHGRPAVDIVMEPPVPPALDGDRLRERVECLSDRLRVVGTDAASEIPAVLNALGDDSRRVRRIELVSVDLESVFLTLTGHRLELESATDGLR